MDLNQDPLYSSELQTSNIDSNNEFSELEYDGVIGNTYNLDINFRFLIFQKRFENKVTNS
jgi:hypothetical protein